MASTTGRRVVEYWTNKSGGGVVAGDVVVLDTTNDEAFTTSTAGAVTGTVGVAQETIANNAAGRICTSGAVALVNVNASVTRGNYGKTHTVAKQATSAGSSRTAGAFCQFTTGGTTPKAHLFGLADSSTSSSGVPAGTSFPGSPATGDLYFRSDLGLLCYYDGTRWLTVHEYSLGITSQDTLLAGTGSPYVLGYMGLDNATYDMYVTRLVSSTTVVTTNTGAAYWTLTVARQPSATALFTYNTSADSPSVNTRHNSTTPVLTGTTDTYIGFTATKTGSPGALYAFAEVIYRRVIT